MSLLTDIWKCRRKLIHKVSIQYPKWQLSFRFLRFFIFLHIPRQILLQFFHIIDIKISFKQWKCSFGNIDRPYFFYNLKQRDNHISKSFNIVISLRIFRLKYLYPINFYDNRRILEIRRIDKKLIIIKQKLRNSWYLQINFPTKIQIKTFLLIIVRRRRYTHSNEIIIH